MRKPRHCAVLIVLLGLSWMGEGMAAEDPRTLLRQSLDLYVVGRYAEAVKILRPLVEAQVLKDRADRLEALRTFGISLYLTNARPGAERAFRNLLRLNAQARLDPSFVRPEVVRFFEGIRRKHLLEIREVERRGSRSAAPNLIPPWGQFRNGHRLKGYLLLSGELTFGITSIATAALLWTWKDDTGQFGEHEDSYQPVSVLNYVSFGLTVALLAYGIIDGLYYHYTAPPKVKTGLLNPNRQLSAGILRF